MKSLLRILRSRRGDLLVEGMVGAVVVGIIFAATVGALLIAGQVSNANSNNSARTIYLNSQLAEKLPMVATVPGPDSPAKSAVKILTRDINAVIWRESDAAITAIYARTASYTNKDPQACLTAEPAPDKQGGCLIAAIRTPNSVGGIQVKALKLVPGTGLVKLVTASPVPAGTEEVRYLFKVTAAPAASSLTFTSDTTGKQFTVPIPAAGTGNYYGSLALPPTATTLSVTTAGPAVFDTTSFFLYGAPTP